jgi:signal transduction histidine kinase
MGKIFVIGKRLTALQHQLNVLDYVPLGECVLQRDGIVLFWNAALERWTNLPRTEAVGRKIDDLLPYFKQFDYISDLQKTFDQGAILTFSFQNASPLTSCAIANQHLQQITITPIPAIVGTGFNALLTIQDSTCLFNQFYQSFIVQTIEEDSLSENQLHHLLPSQDANNQQNFEQQQNLYYQTERTVDRIVQRIRQSLNLKEILQTAVSEIQHFLQVDRVLIYRLGSADYLGRIVAEAGQPNLPSLLDWTRKNAPLGQLECGEYLQFYGQQDQQQVWADSDITKSGLNPSYIQFLRQFSVKARLCIPIFGTEIKEADAAKPGLPKSIGKMQSNLWGWLVAHDCHATRQWTAEEIHLLRHLESQLAVAIHQSELHQQVHQLNINLERQVYVRTLELQQALNFEATLKRITDKVRDSLDEQQILRTVVNELAKALEARYCDTSLYDFHSGVPTLQCSYVGDDPLPEMVQQHLPIEQFPEIYTQLFQGQYVPFCRLPFVEDAPRLAIFACPIVHEQEVLGDLWLFKSGASSFSELEVRLVEQVANQCAIAIRQAQLYKAAHERAEELARLNRLKDDFLSTISHELRTPIASIQMVLQTLALRFVLDSETEQNHDSQSESEAANASEGDRAITQQGKIQQVHEYFHILEKECQREAKLIDDLLDLTRLDAGTEPLVLVPVTLQNWLPYIAETFERQIAEHQQSLAFDLPDNLPTLTTDLTILERIVIELLNNACKYTPLGGAITVSARFSACRPSQLSQCPILQTIQICVSNTGIEIPATELPYVFDKFYRIPSNDPWRYGGTGLGLALVKRMAEYLGGNIQVESQNNITCFRLELAIEQENI